jgi:hypothetical protein
MCAAMYIMSNSRWARPRGRAFKVQLSICFDTILWCHPTDHRVTQGPCELNALRAGDTIPRAAAVAARSRGLFALMPNAISLRPDVRTARHCRHCALDRRLRSDPGARHRVPVDMIIVAFQAGATPEDIAQQFPSVTLTDVRVTFSRGY